MDYGLRVVDLKLPYPVAVVSVLAFSEVTAVLFAEGFHLLRREAGIDYHVLSKNIVDKKRIHNILCFMAKKSFQIEYSMIYYFLINSLLFFIRFREALYD